MSGERLGLGTQILIAMVLGAVLGGVLGERATVLQPAGDLFIRLLVLAAVPLVFFNLAAGLTAHTDVGAIGRVAARILFVFAVTSVVAVSIGIAAMALLEPGVGMTLRMPVDQPVSEPPTLLGVILDLFPSNAVQAFAQGNVLQVVVLAVVVGVATLRLPEGPRDRLRAAFADIAVLMRKIVELILVIAPYGVAALMAVTVGRYGAELFGPMTRFVLGVNAGYLVLIAFYMTLLRFFSTRRPSAFLKETAPVWATTIATTSSLASLPVALEAAEKMRLPRSVYAFVLPLGVQINKDGTAIVLAAVVMFTAQAAGVPLAGADLLKVFVMGSLLSAGSGGIPGGGFVVSLVMVAAFNLPLELAAIVGGIYRLVDMGATTVNVMGDLVGAALVADWGWRRQPVGEVAPITDAAA
jgi:proton glutamate symport protein